MNSEPIEKPRPFIVRWLLGGPGFVVGAFVVSRLLIFGLIALSRTVIVRGNFWHPGGVMSILTQWDGNWYTSIVRDGYNFSTEHQSNMGFFPFYPMLIKLTSYVISNVDMAAVVTANVCLVIAGILLYRLVEMDYGQKVARAAVLFLMFSPVSFFFSSAYTESTFLMLVVGSFLAANQRKWLLAGLLGMMVSATRQVGLILTLPLFVEFVRQSFTAGTGIRGVFHPRVLFLGLVPLGLFFFMLYGHFRFGDFFAFFNATAVWGRELSSPIANLTRYDRYDIFYRWLFLGSLGTAAALWVTGVFLQIRASYLVFTAVMMLVYVSSNSLEAIPRNLSVLFPLFIILAIVANKLKWSYEPTLAASVALLTMCTILSANGHWMT